MKADRTALLATIPVLLLGSVAACATRPFDHHFNARRYAEAAQVFDEDPSLYHDERTLYRAGIVHALPESPVYQPEVARSLFTRLLDAFPRSSHAEEARSMLALLTELQRIERDAVNRQHDLERQVSDLMTEIQRLKHQVSWLEERFETQESQITELSRIIYERLASLREKDDEIRALRAELQRLQEIDLTRPSGPRPASPDTAAADTARSSR